MKTILIFLFTLFLSKDASAVLTFEDHAFPEFVTSARALALGNAYLCKVDDSWSAFYNPAGLGTVRKLQFHLANGHIETNNGYVKAVNEGELTIPNSFKPDLLRQELAKTEMQGRMTHTRVNAFPNITFRGLTLGYMYSQQNRAIVNDDTANEFEIAERKDHGPVGALNISLFGGVLKVGGSAVYLYRRSLYKSFSPTTATSISGPDYREGRSLQITGGTRLTLPIAFLPTFAAVLRNATNNDWEGISTYGAPDKIEQTVDYGFSLTPKLSKRTRFHIEVNFKDAHNAYQTNTLRRWGGGVELDFNRRIFLRGGYGDGWGSGGLGIRSKKLILDLTTYAVERTANDFRKEEDRRWVISLSSGF